MHLHVAFWQHGGLSFSLPYDAVSGQALKKPNCCWMWSVETPDLVSQNHVVGLEN